MPPRAPSGSNTYVPSYDATGPVIQFTRDPSRFRLNQYVKTIGVSKDQGYYLALDPDEPYRVVSENDYLWEDGSDAPAGNGEKMDHEFKPYRTKRRAFPFSIGKKAVDQASWPILAAHGKKTSTKAMTLRTVQSTALLTNPANWGGNTSAASGAWSSSTGNTVLIQSDLNAALIAIEQQTGGIVTDEESLVLVMNPVRARSIAASNEYRDYIKGSPDALASLTDQKNPNRKYGLAPYLYGLKVVVENAMRVTTRKGSNATTRSYIWPDTAAAIVSRPEGLVAAEGEEGLDFSTIAFRFYEEMTVESKSDPDNRRELGRCVEDYVVQMQAPQTGYLFTGLS